MSAWLVLEQHGYLAGFWLQACSPLEQRKGQHLYSPGGLAALALAARQHVHSKICEEVLLIVRSVQRQASQELPLMGEVGQHQASCLLQLLTGDADRSVSRAQ